MPDRRLTNGVSRAVSRAFLSWRASAGGSARREEPPRCAAPAAAVAPAAAPVAAAVPATAAAPTPAATAVEAAAPVPAAAADFATPAEGALPALRGAATASPGLPTSTTPSTAREAAPPTHRFRRLLPDIVPLRGDCEQWHVSTHRCKKPTPLYDWPEATDEGAGAPARAEKTGTTRKNPPQAIMTLQRVSVRQSDQGVPRKADSVRRPQGHHLTSAPIGSLSGGLSLAEVLASV